MLDWKRFTLIAVGSRIAQRVGNEAKLPESLEGTQMMGNRRVSRICGVAASIAFAAFLVMGQLPGSEKAEHPACRATGEVCFVGIDPDVYQMPLFGENIQSGNPLICATRNWSSFPPETFSIDFLRAFWSQLTPQYQAATEGAGFGFLSTHWGPPDVPAADLSAVATIQRANRKVDDFLTRWVRSEGHRVGTRPVYEWAFATVGPRSRLPCRDQGDLFLVTSRIPCWC